LIRQVLITNTTIPRKIGPEITVSPELSTPRQEAATYALDIIDTFENRKVPVGVLQDIEQ